MTEDGVRVGVDIGGTFTDIVVQRADGALIVNKTSSTPQDLSEAVLAGLQTALAEAGVPAAAVVEIVHGTTVASNTLLQKSGARTGVLTTRGFLADQAVLQLRSDRMRFRPYGLAGGEPGRRPRTCSIRTAPPGRYPRK